MLTDSLQAAFTDHPDDRDLRNLRLLASIEGILAYRGENGGLTATECADISQTLYEARNAPHPERSNNAA